MSIKKSDSGSDVSSNSSWTVIEEVQETLISNTVEHPDPIQNSGVEVIKTTEVVTYPDGPNEKDNDFVKVTFSDASIKQSSDEETESFKNETRENGFLTFDEYLQERMLEHDYDYPNQTVFKRKLSKTKKFSKNRSKCKAETIGVLSLCASLLTVTGIALLCLIFPENIDAKNFDTIRSNCQAISNNDSLDYNNIVTSFNKTMQVLEAANSSKLLAKSADSVTKKAEYRYRPFRRTIGPMNEVATSRYRLNRKNRNSNSALNIFKNDVCYPKNNNGVCYACEDPRLVSSSSKKQRIKPVEMTKLIQESKNQKKFNSTANKNQTTALTSIESVLAGTNLKSIIRSIIHDICILKLITYLNKKKEEQETNKKSNKGEQKASKRKLFDAIADGMERIAYEDNKDRRIRTARRKNKTKKQPLKHKEGSTKTSPSSTSKQNFLLQLSRQSVGNSVKTDLIPKFENGKSECERRFEELDNHRKRSQEVCSKHKINIQQIKQQYRSEVDAIKDSNIEPMVRLHRIQTLREKYRLQLKKNREIYMREMSKMKRLRTNMLKELCTQKRMEFETKDAAVGSYVVPIEQDFYSRLQQMKEKEASRYAFNIQGLNNNGQTEPIFTLPSSYKNNYDISTFHFPSPPIFGEYMNNNAQECSKSKRQCIKSTDNPSKLEFSLDLDIMKEHASGLSNTLDENSPLKQRTDEDSPNKNSDDSEEVEVRHAIDRRRIQGHLYQIAFEKKGQMIENSDKMKWRQKRVEHWLRREPSKQDPQKSYKPNIIVHKY